MCGRIGLALFSGCHIYRSCECCTVIFHIHTALGTVVAAALDACIVKEFGKAAFDLCTACGADSDLGLSDHVPPHIKYDTLTFFKYSDLAAVADLARKHLYFTEITAVFDRSGMYRRA